MGQTLNVVIVCAKSARQSVDHDISNIFPLHITIEPWENKGEID